MIYGWRTQSKTSRNKKTHERKKRGFKKRPHWYYQSFSSTSVSEEEVRKHKMKIKNWTAYLGDCLEIMKWFDSESIDLTVTSPPYDNLRTYNDSLNWNFDIFKEIAKEIYRVTKQGWVLVWVVWDETNKFCESMTSFRQALYFNEIWFNILDTMIYYKQNYAPAYPTLRRYANQFEYMFVFSKGKPKTFNPVQREKVRSTDKKSQYRKPDWEIVKRFLKQNKRDLKDASNVWEYPVWFKNLWHPAVFPEKLAEDHILSWSNPWDIVLDPFGWSFTTGKMAELNWRKWICIEKDDWYYNIGVNRIQNLSN